MTRRLPPSTPALITALRGGEIDIAVEILGPVMSQINAKAVRVLAVMGEVLAAAAADGTRLEATLMADELAKTLAMPSYAPSMQLDAEAGRPLELEAIYRVPLARAASHGVAMPEARRLLTELEALPANRST